MTEEAKLVLEFLKGKRIATSHDIRKNCCPANYPTKFMRELKKLGCVLKRGTYSDEQGHPRYVYKLISYPNDILEKQPSLFGRETANVSNRF